VDAAVLRERRFLADASHELRSPLALLRAEIELALDRPRPARELKEALRSAGDETDRLSQLAEDLLLLARLQEDGLPVRREPTALRELLDGVAERFRPRAARAGRAIALHAGDEAVEADRVRLGQAVGNLLENALRHGTGDVTISTRVEGDLLELHVVDEGPGFPEAFLSRALERFTRADESRGTAGTGLGLAIVAAIAEAHGGTLRVANGASGGADVCLAIALLAARRHGQPATSRRGSRAAP
jgi:signal transduction histidine kinase